LSALPFAPKQSKVSQQFLPQFPQTLSIEAGQATDWPAIQHILPVNHRSGSFCRCATFSHDSKHIVSGSHDGEILVWDADTGAIVSGPFQHPQLVLSVAFSLDDKRVISFADDSTICIWEVETGAMIFKLYQREENRYTGILSAICSWDGKHVISCCDSCEEGRIIYDVEPEKVVTRSIPGPMHASCVRSIACSWDAKYIASASEDGLLRIYDLEAEAIVFSTFHGDVTCLALSPDGRCIVFCTSLSIHILDTETRAILSGPFQQGGDSSCAAFSLDGKRVVSCLYHDRQSLIYIWDANTGAIISGPFHGPTSWIGSVAFSPDGQHIVSCSEDSTIRIWDAAGGAVFPCPEQGHAASVDSVSFSHDGKYVVSASRDKTICTWNAETGAISSRPIERNLDVDCVTFSEDSTYIRASGVWNDTITIWNMVTGIIVSSKSVSPLAGNFPNRYSLVSLDGKHAVIQTAKDKICIWNAETGALPMGLSITSALLHFHMTANVLPLVHLIEAFAYGVQRQPQ
jgi:WD40 repeat protein